MIRPLFLNPFGNRFSDTTGNLQLALKEKRIGIITMGTIIHGTVGFVATAKISLF